MAASLAKKGELILVLRLIRVTFGTNGLLPLLLLPLAVLLPLPLPASSCVSGSAGVPGYCGVLVGALASFAVAILAEALQLK